MSVITQKQGTLEYLTAEGITVPHCFTTRFGGVSTGIFDSMNIAIKEGETAENVRANIGILSAALGFDSKNLITTRQTHSDIVRVVSKADHIDIFHRDYPECDAIVTNDPGTALMIYTADCTPLLLHDPVTGAVGAAHAGWKGTVKAIGAKTVQTMVNAFGCDPANIRAAIGPNIGACHFETDSDVPEALTAAFGAEAEQFIRKSGEKYYVNLKGINALILRRTGVRHIEISDCCTVCQHHRFWSHRYTKGQRGSQGAIILCKEAAK
jgi:YfiH family protein